MPSKNLFKNKQRALPQRHTAAAASSWQTNGSPHPSVFLLTPEKYSPDEPITGLEQLEQQHQAGLLTAGSTGEAAIVVEVAHGLAGLVGSIHPFAALHTGS